MVGFDKCSEKPNANAMYGFVSKSTFVYSCDPLYKPMNGMCAKEQPIKEGEKTCEVSWIRHDGKCYKFKCPRGWNLYGDLCISKGNSMKLPCPQELRDELGKKLEGLKPKNASSEGATAGNTTAENTTHRC
ncbi:uncharacterized protein LOC141910594 [Tubulanus polymorphus]|uniref:uncharacterized protein LOC141910594 n=1 Tax=Tubulanus polymorphus TaxID=672921 RepID=UPI003DA3C698